MKKIAFEYGHLLNLTWIILLVGLPMTSFPAFARLTRSIVMPFSTLPVMILLIVWFIPYILRRGSLPVESKPVFIFLLIAVASCALAFFIPIPDLKNVTVAGQELRALFSLGIGSAFFLLTAAWSKSSEQLTKTLRWIYIGGVILVAWTMLQAYFIFQRGSNFPEWIKLIQDWLVVRSPNFTSDAKRLIGLAYEPAWFAHQLVLFYLPLWIAATCERKSVFNIHILGLSLENIMLVAGLCEFHLSSPRISLLSLVLIIILLSMKAYRKFSLQVARAFANKSVNGSITSRFVQIAIAIGIGIGFVASFAVVFAGLVYLGSLRDWRLALVAKNIPTWEEIKSLITLNEGILMEIANRLAFLERMVTWIAGWRIFNLHPWSGVGLGNSGFFMPDQMPALGWATAEVRSLLNDPNALANIKSLWLRILSETGLVGFSTILLWMYFLWRSTRLSYHSDQSSQKVIALAGELFLIALVSEGFNVDYFAMPYLWVFAGLISSNGLVYRAQIKHSS